MVLQKYHVERAYIIYQQITYRFQYHSVWILHPVHSQGQEEVKVKLSVDCELVTIMEVIRGQLEVTNTHVYFLDCSSNKIEGRLTVIGDRQCYSSTRVTIKNRIVK